jgi:uncharacterized membrane protein YcgQ (UPF0703/DUF1980 family)
MKILTRTLPPLTLFEWGAICTYFYFSGRIASFLHPMFRPWVLVTGVLLIITALCVALFPEETCGHEHAHEHEEGHLHGQLTAGNVIAFFLLLIPFALAAKISPDSYGADLIRRRGLVEDIRGLPGVNSRVSRVPSPTNPTPPASLSAQAAVQHQSIARAAATLRKRPEQSISKSLEIDAQAHGDEPALPTQNGDGEDAPPPPSDGIYQNEFLKPNSDGNIKVQVTDLLYAAQESFTRKDFEGKRVEIIGQYLVPKQKGAKEKIEPNSFMLLRLVMVCCAADMMPAAVKIEPTKKPAHCTTRVGSKSSAGCTTGRGPKE